jgi:Skp family chaperone for outer membrane proteins
MGRPKKVQNQDVVKEVEDKDLGEGIENFEQEVENLKNTKMKLFGITMTPTTIGALFAIITTVIGSLYGAFQVYNDYMGMKEIVQNINVDAIKAENEKVILKLNESLLRIEEGTEYTRDIKQGLRDDLLNIEKQVDRMEDELRKSENDIRKIVQNAEERFENKRDSLQNDYDKKAGALRDTTDQKIKDLESRLNSRLQRALDNPLAR